MLALQALQLHPLFYKPKTDRSLIINNVHGTTHYETHRLLLFVLPKRFASASLLPIPRATPVPHPPPEDAGTHCNTYEESSELPPEISITSESEPRDKDPPKKTSTVKLAAVFGFWYLQNVIFNIYNKKTLNLFPYPWLLASFQLFVGSLWMAGLWASRLQPYPQVNREFFLALLVPALFHTIGHISACISFSKVAVSFTHVIKASEPVFSVLFSALFGQFYPIQVWLSLAPIVAGCALAAVTEVSFNAEGLWGALISNVGFVLRNIYSKKSLHDFKHVDGLNLYGWISILSLLYLLPVAVVVEGRHWVQGYRTATAAVASPSTLYAWVILSGVFYHLYNQSSYQALDEISPLSFSVGNTMKRVVVIVASVIAFRNPIRPLNAVGSAIAIFGTFLYSQATVATIKNDKINDALAKKTS